MLCHKTSRNSDMTDFRSPVKIVGQLNPNVISTALHEAAARNDRRKIKKILKSGGLSSAVLTSSAQNYTIYIFSLLKLCLQV